MDPRDGETDANGMDIIEEEGGAVGVAAGKEKAKRTDGEATVGHLEDEDADGEEEGSEKGDEVIDTGWEEVYEQEV